MLDEGSRETWESVCRMSLDQVDLYNLMLDARDEARIRARKVKPGG